MGWPAGAAPSEASSLPAKRAAPWSRWWQVVGAFTGLLAGVGLVAPAIALPPVLGFAVGFCVVAGSALLTALATPAVTPRRLLLALLPLALLGVLGLLDPEPRIGLAAAVTVALLLGGSLVGAGVGTAIEHSGQLLFVAVVSSAADVFSVFHPRGPSAAIAESEAALSLLALPWPLLGTSELPPFLGVGDVIFTALYVAAARRHALSLPRTAFALAAAYVVTMLAVIRFAVPVPALPLLGLAMVLAHPAARRPQERDRVRGYAVSAAVVVLVLLLFWR